MNSINANQNSPRLLDQLRTAIRYKLYSRATEKADVYWVRFYIRFHSLQHPVKMRTDGVRIMNARQLRIKAVEGSVLQKENPKLIH